MTTCLGAAALAFIAAVLGTVVVRRLALRLGVVDRPDGYRKIHQREMPRLGGVAIYAAFALPLVALWCFPTTGLAPLIRRHAVELLGLLAGSAVALTAGIVDDARGLSPRWKLLAQAVAASIVIAAGLSLDAISNPFGGTIRLGLLGYPITLLWLVGCMNAVNLLDGLDGLAAGACLFVSITLFLVSMMFGQTLCMVLMACLSGAILGFLCFNFHPASIFLGDSGSMLLGLLVGALSLLGTCRARVAGAQLIPVIALGLPLLDTTLAILRRWSRKLPVSAADRQHVHHVLLSMGLSHRRAVLILYLACVSLGGAAMLVTVERAEVTLLVLGSLGIAVFASARLLGAPRLVDLWGRVSEELARSHRASEARVAVARAIARMRAASSTDALWQEFCEVPRGLDLDFATLRLHDSPYAEPLVLSWPGSSGEAMGRLALEPDVWSARLSIRGNGSAFGELEVGKASQDSPLPSYAPELLDRARREMAMQIERLAESGALAATATLLRQSGAEEIDAEVDPGVVTHQEWHRGTPLRVG